MFSSIQQNLDYFRTNSLSGFDSIMQLESANDSNQTQPHLVIVGTVHGNEFVGAETCVFLHNLIVSGYLKLKKGKISFVLGNPKAYEQQVRFIDENLNRVFDGKPAGSSLERKRAAEISKFFAENPDISTVLDLHSVSVGDIQMCVYSDISFCQLAKQITPFGMHFCSGGIKQGFLIDYFENIPSFVVECGNHKDSGIVKTALKIVFNLLLKYEMVDIENQDLWNLYFQYKQNGMVPTSLTHLNSALDSKSFESPEKVTIYLLQKLISPGSNFSFLDSNVHTGYFVKEGSVYAKDDQKEHRANQDGFIIMPDKSPKVGDTDAGFFCTMVEG